MRRMIAHLLVILVLAAVWLVVQGTGVALPDDRSAVLCAAPDGTPEASGACWEHPLDLLTALRSAEPGAEVWIRQGVYTPGDGPDSAFYVPDGVTLLGGFTGSTSEPSERSSDPGRTVLDGRDERYSVLIAAGVSDAEVSSLTIQNGAATLIADEATDLQRRGGGIFVSNADVRLSNLMIANNRARFGGAGIYVDEGSQVEIINSTLQGNQTTHPQSGRGGAVRVIAGQVNLRDVTIRSNQAFRGGGIFVDDGHVRIDNSLVAENRSTDRGGALSVFAGEVDIAGTRVVLNHAGREGGGLFVSRSSPSTTLKNVELAGNTAGDGGGGAWITSDTVTLLDTSFIDNDGQHGPGGGIAVAGASTQIENTVIAGNHAAFGGGIAIADAQVSGVNLLISGNAAAPARDGSSGRIFNQVSDRTQPVLTGVVTAGVPAANLNPLETVRERDDDLVHSGGGVSVSGTGRTVLVNTTIAGNWSVGGGPGTQRFGNNTLEVSNSIVSGNASSIYEVASEAPPLASTDEVESTTRLRITRSLIEHGCPQGHGIRCHGAFEDDPRFLDPRPPSAAPTSAGDYRLWFTSPAIDAADASLLSSDVDHDLDGNPRFVDKRSAGGAFPDGLDLDLGPFEAQVPASEPGAHVSLNAEGDDATVTLDVTSDQQGTLRGEISVETTEFAFQEVIPGRIFREGGNLILDGEALLDSGNLAGFRIELDTSGRSGAVWQFRIRLDTGERTIWHQVDND